MKIKIRLLLLFLALGSCAPAEVAAEGAAPVSGPKAGGVSGVYAGGGIILNDPSDLQKTRLPGGFLGGEYTTGKHSFYAELGFYQGDCSEEHGVAIYDDSDMPASHECCPDPALSPMGYEHRHQLSRETSLGLLLVGYNHRFFPIEDEKLALRVGPFAGVVLATSRTHESYTGDLVPVAQQFDYTAAKETGVAFLAGLNASAEWCLDDDWSVLAGYRLSVFTSYTTVAAEHHEMEGGMVHQSPAQSSGLNLNHHLHLAVRYQF